MNRVPPHDLAAERALLGCVLLASSALGEIADVRTNDLYVPVHREILESARAVAAAGQPIDVITIGDEAKRRGGTVEASLLLELANEVPVLSNVRHYARIVSDKASLRRLIEACGEMQGAAWAGDKPTNEILAEAQRLVHELAANALGAREPVKLSEAVRQAMDEIEAWTSGKGDSGVKTGIASFDEHFGGFGLERFVVVAGRPGQGKTAFVGSVALNAARAGHPVLFFSGEMSLTELARRALSQTGGVDGEHMANGHVDLDEWKAILKAAAELDGLPFWLISENLEMGAIEAAALRWEGRLAAGMAEGEVFKKPLVVVDYMQLIDVPGTETAERTIAEASKACKRLAKSLKSPVVGVSSLNRASDKREGGENKMSDLRGSGQVEFDADMILFIRREENKRDATTGAVLDEYEAEADVRKNRGGKTGKARLWWHGPTTSFTSPPEESFT